MIDLIIVAVDAVVSVALASSPSLQFWILVSIGNDDSDIDDDDDEVDDDDDDDD